MPRKYDYDAIIIGAGISGLVCGCYLAKAGMKTLIVEKNEKPGGYCTSFRRNGFRFDACVHSLGSFGKKGHIAKILQELNIDKKIKINRYDPQDIIIAPDYKVTFWNSENKTISELQKKFPREATSINQFFNFLNNCSGSSFNSLRRITLQDLIDKYFKNDKLKAVLSLPILGNAGLPPSKASAFMAVTMYKEFILDGGYYPEGGIQALPNALLKRFKEFGGKALLSCLVDKIEIKNNCAKGIKTEGNRFISSKYLISNIDATQTFLNLAGEKVVNKGTITRLNNLKPSLSMFILYLGVDENVDGIPANINTWFLPHYDIEKMYRMANKGEVESLDWFLVRLSQNLSQNKKSIIMLVNSSFKDSDYWRSNKERLINIFIEKIGYLIPDLPRHIIIKDAATPNTLYKRTLNYKGAAYGWEGVPSQFAILDFAQTTSINNLYLTGHWTTLVQGISGVAYLGRSTAENVLNREK